MEARQISPARAALGTAVLMGIASVVVGYLTLTQWYGVQVPTLALGALALLLGPLAALLVTPDLQRIDQRRTLWVAGLNIALGAGIAVAAGMPWKQASVRAGLLDRGATMSQGRAAEFAIQDKSEEVALAACRWTYKRGELWQRRSTTQQLKRLPMRAMRCLEEVDPGDDKTLNARAELVRAWAQALLGGEALDEQTAGSLIGGLSGLATRDDIAAAAVLTCALGHSDAAYRVLCGEALASKGLTGEGLMAAVDRADEEGLAQVWRPKLLTYAYHQYGLTPDDKQTAIKLGLLLPEVRSFAMASSCAALPAMGDKMVEQFKALATASCDVQGEMIRKTDGLWSEVCEAQEQRKKKGSAAFCESLNQELTLRATTAAMSHVHAALSEQQSKLMATSITRAHSAAKGTLKEKLVREMGAIAFQRYYSNLPQEGRLALDKEGPGQGTENTKEELESLKNSDWMERANKDIPPELQTYVKRLNDAKTKPQK